jgi:hypothetical protein
MYAKNILMNFILSNSYGMSFFISKLILFDQNQLLQGRYSQNISVDNKGRRS